MATFPLVQTEDRNINQLQRNIANALNPVLANPTVSGTIIENVELAVGSNIVDHKLGRKLQGWVIVRKRAAADIYDTQDTNTQPTRTLLLVSDAEVMVDIYCF